MIDVLQGEVVEIGVFENPAMTVALGGIFRAELNRIKAASGLKRLDRLQLTGSGPRRIQIDKYTANPWGEVSEEQRAHFDKLVDYLAQAAAHSAGVSKNRVRVDSEFRDGTRTHKHCDANNALRLQWNTSDQDMDLDVSRRPIDPIAVEDHVVDANPYIEEPFSTVTTRSGGVTALNNTNPRKKRIHYGANEFEGRGFVVFDAMILDPINLTTLVEVPPYDARFSPLDIEQAA